MLQQVMTKPGEIIFREVPVPEVKDDQVLVKIMNIGICGSDIHVYHGKHPFTKYPVTQDFIKDRRSPLNHRYIVDTAIHAAMENIISARN